MSFLALRRWADERRAATRRVVFCTIATPDYLSWALSLFDSVRRHHPRATLLLLAVGRNADDRAVPRLDGVEVIWTRHLVDAASEAALRRRYTMSELCFSLKPRLLRYALEHFGDRAIYLDSDIYVCNPLTEALLALESASAAITPHLDRAIPMDGKLPSDLTILRAGTFNLGFVAVAADAHARAFLDWWDERVVRWGFVAPEAGYLGDQKWIDLVPSLFPAVAVLRDPGSNLGYWNLHSRRVARKPSGRWLANRAPLAFVHLSGFDPRHPARLSRFENRFDPGDNPEVLELAREFAAHFEKAGARASRVEWQSTGESAAPAAGSASHAENALVLEAYRARIGPSFAGGILGTGEEAVMRVTVGNDSPHPWPVARAPGGGGGIALTWHLLDERGAPLVFDNARFFLPRDLQPGESVDVPVGIRVPLRPGLYFIEFDLVHEGHAWFADHGSPKPRVELLVDAFRVEPVPQARE
ncbi:MAG TPA: hypothetical protein VEC19_10705 [Usitatibacter sp.]|nr:hypothetical protein [Usitatibacter sp.]